MEDVFKVLGQECCEAKEPEKGYSRSSRVEHEQLVGKQSLAHHIHLCQPLCYRVRVFMVYISGMPWNDRFPSCLKNFLLNQAFFVWKIFKQKS